MKKATFLGWLFVSQVGQLNRVLLDVRANPQGMALTLSRDLLFDLEERLVFLGQRR